MRLFVSELVTVSNGREFFRIPAEQLRRARAGGFYRPREKQRTIVSNGTEILEIQLSDLKAATRDGFRDVLAKETPLASKSPNLPAENPESAAANQTDGSKISAYRQAEIEREEHYDRLINNVEASSLIGRVPALLRLWWFEQRDSVLGQFRTSGLSIALHVALLLLLSSVLLVNERPRDKDIITMSSSVEQPIEEVVIEQVDLEIEEPVEEEVEETNESPEVVSDVTEQFVSINVADAFDGSMLSEPASSSGEGEAMEKPTKAKVKFFGSKTEAIDFVFVIDNSNSMTKGRFETALNELIKAVGALSKRQKFYVIFYSDTAYPLFHPYAAKSLVPATFQNKLLLTKWLQTVPLCLKTNGKEALELGFKLDPDVMFVLGDGAFTDGASRYFSTNPNKKVVVHTLGMEVTAKNAETFKQLATAHRGTYQDVGVHPQAAVMAQKFPRPKNRTRNGYWGLKLPAQPKPKK